MGYFTLALTLPFPFPDHSPHPVPLISSRISSQMELKSTIIVLVCYLMVSQALNVEALPARVPSHSPGSTSPLLTSAKKHFPEGWCWHFKGLTFCSGLTFCGSHEPLWESTENCERSPRENKLPFKNLPVNLDGLGPIWSPIWEIHRAHMKDPGFLECL